MSVGRQPRSTAALHLRRPFAIFVEPCLEIEGNWNASIVGADGLDNVTFSDSPEGAVGMAAELIWLVTERCPKTVDHVHRFTVDTRLSGFSADGEVVVDEAGPAAWGCEACELRVAKSEFPDGQ